MIWTALMAASLAAPCLEPTPMDTPLQVRPPENADVVVIAEIHVAPNGVDWARRVLAQADQRDIDVAVVVRMEELDAWEPESAFFAEITQAGHELTLFIDPGDTNPDLVLHAVKTQSKRLKRWSKARTRVARTTKLDARYEAWLGKYGYLTVLAADQSEPRPAIALDGQPAVGVIIPAGPFEGDCGTEPVIGAWTPAMADRATIALRQAADDTRTRFLRMGLGSTFAVDGDAALFGTWLDTIIAPSGAVMLDPIDARAPARAAARRQVAMAFVDEAPGRRVDVAEVNEVAISLSTATVLHRQLASMNPTEAFYALMSVITDRIEGPTVRMRPLDGPRNLATTSLIGPVDIDAVALVALANQLLDTPPDAIPAAVPVGDRLLTAAEILVAMASLANGDTPPFTHPISVPDPNQPGLGWGSTR